MTATSSIYHTIPKPDDMVVCPYDKVHVVRYKRLPYHLMKCRKNHTNVRMATCHFNARHQITEAELRFHMLECPDRAHIERHTIDETKNCGFNEVPTYFPDVEIPSTEDWDAEALAMPRIGVPASQIAGIGYIKNLQGFKPAQKKLYYKNLRDNRPEANAALISSMNEAAGAMEGHVEHPDGAEELPKMRGFAQPVASFGRGRGAVARSAASTPGSATPLAGVAPRTGAGRGDGINVNAGGSAQVQKDIRRLRKKLGQIEELEEKLASGSELLEEERAKLCLKDTLQVNLQQLIDAL